jgi:hypothetical protein
MISAIATPVLRVHKKQLGLLFDHPTKFVFKRDRCRAKLFTPRRASDSAIVFQIAAIPHAGADIE